MQKQSIRQIPRLLATFSSMLLLDSMLHEENCRPKLLIQMYTINTRKHLSMSYRINLLELMDEPQQIISCTVL